MNEVETIIANIEQVLAESYPNVSLPSLMRKQDGGQHPTNDTLTMPFICMAVIVFIVGGTAL